MYTFIADLGSDVANLRSPELEALAKVWRERKTGLEGTAEYQEFTKKLQREWAIETGIIERLYTWDRGVTEVLIAQGIEASLIAHRGGISRHRAETVAAMIRDHGNVVEGLFTFVGSKQPLSEFYIRQIHEGLTAHQDVVEAQTNDGRSVEVALRRGEYKRHPNNPQRHDGTMHHYCPPEHVAQEMQHLIRWFNDREGQGERAEVLAAFLHHRFTQIHPFQDGNGRVARALATIVFLKCHLFPLVIRDSERKDYIEALEKADQGDLKSLCDLFARNQKKSILAALGIEQSVQRSRYAETIMSAGIQLLRNQSRAETGRLDAVFNLAERLRTVTIERLEAIVRIYAREFDMPLPGRPGYRIAHDSDGNASERREWFRHQVLELAGQYGYFANFGKYCSWAFLSISTLNRFQWVVAFHGLGPVHRGIMAASSFSLFRIEREDGRAGTDVIDLRPASPDYFQFNYMEPADSVEARFREWLEGSLAIGLSEWQSALAREVAI